MFLLPFSSLFGVDFVDLFPSLVFLDYISPFNICCQAGLVVLNSFNFYLSEKPFISPLILNEIFARYSNLGCIFFPFSTLNIYWIWCSDFVLVFSHDGVLEFEWIKEVKIFSSHLDTVYTLVVIILFNIYALLYVIYVAVLCNT